MDISVALPSFATKGWRFPPSRLEEFAKHAESSGFGGVWVTEHLCRPPGRNYSRLDPLTTLSTIAGTTSTIQLGTSILILPLRNPVLTAQRIATLQYLSENRLTIGLGIGWVEAEYDAAGIPFSERGPRFTEGLELLRCLLEGGEITFNGEYYQVESFRLEPEVDRMPRILLAGSGVMKNGEKRVPTPVKRRLVDFSDGWLAPPIPPEALTTDWQDIASFIEDQGENPETFRKVALTWLHLVPKVDTTTATKKQQQVYLIERGSSPQRAKEAVNSQLSGSVSDVQAQLDSYREQKFDEVIIGPTTPDPNDVNRQIAYWAENLL